MRKIDRETIITGKQIFDLYNEWEKLPEGKAHFNNWVREQDIEGKKEVPKITEDTHLSAKCFIDLYEAWRMNSTGRMFSEWILDQPWVETNARKPFLNLRFGAEGVGRQWATGDILPKESECHEARVLENRTPLDTIREAQAIIIKTAEAMYKEICERKSNPKFTLGEVSYRFRDYATSHPDLDRKHLSLFDYFMRNNPPV